MWEQIGPQMLDCHGPTFHIVPSFHLVNRQIVADFDIFRAVELCRNSIKDKMGMNLSSRVYFLVRGYVPM